MRLDKKTEMKLYFAILVAFVHYSATMPMDEFNEVTILEGKVTIGSFLMKLK